MVLDVVGSNPIAHPKEIAGQAIYGLGGVGKSELTLTFIGESLA